MMQVLSIKSGATTKEQYLSPGKLMILTGPSGVGKGTLMRTLLQRHPELYYSVSATTRTPRSGETDGINYYFVSRTKFEQLVASGEFLEWAEFAGNYYGTPRQPVLEKVNSGKTVLLEIELDGARQVRTSFPQAISIFILPPSLEELEKRIRSRNQDSEDAIARRLILAQDEITAADEFDIQIVNDDFETALCSLEQAIFG
ncbi:guanylate kinase [Mastigocoleus sp. MO_188.B34]|uniref:guanylate kinase n=1 Tax=Mastigocoleus sp. MO_188.B34 TaxID=3036635 RepID=UPI0026101EE2|nr:guanylate kinase [Mastigocoleus sp. MO_188.B34]MDJ0695227.1 guanylate kinase [Mastigocoleus sp. MO_188.B34]